MIRRMGALAACAVALAACDRVPNFDVDGLRVYGVDGAGNVVEFGTRSAGEVRRLRPQGLQEGESLVGIDNGLTDAVLLGVGSTGRVYEVGRGARNVPLTALGGPFFGPVAAGEAFGVAGEPGVAALRVLGSGGQNVRVAAGGASVAPALAYAAGDPGAFTSPRIVAAAYASDGTLFAIDGNRDVLVVVTPSTGEVRSIGALGVNAGDDTGFDVAREGVERVAFATFTFGGVTELHRVDLATGAAVQVRRVATRTPIRSIALLDRDRVDP